MHFSFAEVRRKIRRQRKLFITFFGKDLIRGQKLMSAYHIRDNTLPFIPAEGA